MKITALTENTSRRGLPVEHGLSLYIETGERKILFDTGQTELFARNAELLGIDLAAVELAVISHGHYDHGGGLMKFFEINSSAPVYINKNAFEPHYRDGAEKYIGLNPGLIGNKRFVLVDGDADLGGGLSLHSCIGRERRYDFGSQGLNAERGGELVPDDFRHEHYLLIRENGRRVLISGCSHKGILNIVGWFKPDVLVGGFHFMKLEPGGLLRGYSEELAASGTSFYTCHCTGTEQYEFMKKYIPALGYLSAGDTIEI